MNLGSKCMENYLFLMGGVCNIGSNVTIRSGFDWAVLGGYEKTRLYVAEGAELRIGDNSGISSSVLCATDSIFVGDHVNIGAGCLITDSDHHSLNYYNRCLAARDNNIQNKSIRIEDGAFIGANSIILKGVTIGKRSIVGAGSVVTKDIPEDEIWAGNPSVFIKKIDNSI